METYSKEERQTANQVKRKVARQTDRFVLALFLSDKGGVQSVWVGDAEKLLLSCGRAHGTPSC
eukprot:2951948-Pleurochrysis_carterae.AAC.1